MNGGESLDAGYFDALYARDADPWRMKTSEYERDKYQDTLAALEGRRFRSGLEVGCANGELSAVLAPACDRYLGIDIAEAPLAQARERNALNRHVRFERMTLPRERPEGPFDLIVLSEVLYYFSLADLREVADWVGSALASDGVALLVHWLGETPDYPLTGDEAVEAFLKGAPQPMTRDRRWRRESYRIDRLVRPSPDGSISAAPL